MRLEKLYTKKERDNVDKETNRIKDECESELQ